MRTEKFSIPQLNVYGRFKKLSVTAITTLSRYNISKKFNSKIGIFSLSKISLQIIVKYTNGTRRVKTVSNTMTVLHIRKGNILKQKFE